MINPSDIFNIIEFSFNAYDGLHEFKWPLILVAMIGYVYLGVKSITATVAAILLTFVLVGASVWAGVPDISSFMAIITVIGLACLVLAVLLKKEGVYSGYIKE